MIINAGIYNVSVNPTKRLFVPVAPTKTLQINANPTNRLFARVAPTKILQINLVKIVKTQTFQPIEPLGVAT